MSERIHALAQVLLGKSSLDECSIEEIQHLAKRYPYFAPAQFLLLQKLKSTGSPEAEKQQQKAVLYYHDPLQFDYFVSAEKFYIDESILSEKNVAVAPTYEAEKVKYAHHAEEVVEEEKPLFYQDVNETSNDINTEEIVSPDEIEEQPDETTSAPLEQSESFAEIKEAEEREETTSEKVNEEEISAEKNSISEATPAIIETQELNEVSEPKHFFAESNVEQLVEKQNSENSFPSESKEPIALVTPSDELKNAEPLAFEPYHTVDYFASQGIKISAEELPKDKLGKQLRSFTEWLKMMKRLPAAEASKTPETTAEKTVENMAMHSVDKSDIITEAMAEVWTKQGNREKAMETYNKLSLLNPSKKAYFAAKIENLKQS